MSTFAATLAIDEDGNIAPEGSIGQPFAPDDTEATTPLDIFDLNGIPVSGNQLICNSYGVVPAFRFDGLLVVDWVSGDFRIPIPCIDQLPAGGTTGQVLAKTSGSDFAAEWVDPTGGGSGVPSGGTAGQVLTKISATEGDAEWRDPSSAGTGMLYYSGTAWPARDDTPNPIMWVSTKHPSAPQPGGIVVGDSWLRHPDAVGL
jgi:hypothetical protein